MKALFMGLCALLFSSQIFAADEYFTSVQPYSNPSCSDLPEFALRNKPQSLENNYLVDSAVAVNQNFDIFYRVGEIVNDVTVENFETLKVEKAPCFSDENTKQKIAQLTSSYLSLLSSKTSGIRADEVNGDDKNNSSKAISQTMTLNPSSVGFWGKTYAEWRPIIEEAQGLFLLVSLLIALGFAAKSLLAKGAAKSLENSQNVNFGTEGGINQILIALTIIFIFYAGSPSSGQSMFAWLSGMGSDSAAGITHKVQSANLNRAIQKSAEGSESKIEEMASESVILSQKIALNQQILGYCVDEYVVGQMYKRGGYIFPSVAAKDEMEAQYQLLKGGTSGEGSRPNTFFSISTCAAAERALKADTQKLREVKKYFQNLQKWEPQELQKNVNAAQKINFSTGWMSIVYYPVQKHLSSGATNLDKRLAASAMDNTDFGGHQTGHSFDFKKFFEQFSNIDFSKTISSTSQGLVLVGFVPGGEQIYNLTKSFSNGIINMITAIPQAGVNAFTKGSGDTLFENGKTAVSSIVSFYVAVDIMQFVVDNLPLIVLLVIGCIAVSLYLFELLTYTLSVPFAIVWAFSPHAREKITEFIGKGVAVAIKPVLIVISITAATEIVDFYRDLITPNLAHLTSALDGATKAKLAATEWSLSAPLAGLGSYIFGLMKNGILSGIIYIVSLVAETWLAAKLIISGPDKFLSYFTSTMHSMSDVADNIMQKSSNTKLGA